MEGFDLELLNANKEAHPEVYERVYDNAIEEKVRKRYRVEKEISFLRQQYRKPEEFAEYDAYVEECKAEVKREFGMEV
jgi:hypothetical protein